jgi:mono/diheme cytochrome c family protein
MGQSVVRLGCAALLITALALFCTLPAQADDAAAVFKSKCAICHAADGSGNSPTGKAMKVPDLLSADAQKKTDADLDGIITNGKNKMPSYKDKLSADQIKQLVSFIRDLAKKK